MTKQITTKSHRTKFRVYYEDTDAGGVVYHANYLRFAARARTEYLLHVFKMNIADLADKGLVFVVTKLEINYKRPLKLMDEFTIESKIYKLPVVCYYFEQKFTMGSKVVCIVRCKVASLLKNKVIRVAKINLEKFNGKS